MPMLSFPSNGYSGHESKKSLEVYQHLSLESVDKAYQDAVQSVGI
jgi:integrase/recombinase XerD